MLTPSQRERLVAAHSKAPREIDREAVDPGPQSTDCFEVLGVCHEFYEAAHTAVPALLDSESRLEAEFREHRIAAMTRDDAVRALLDALAFPDGRNVRAAWEQAALLYGRTHDVMKRAAFEQYLDELAGTEQSK